jgi:chloramphenicol 3-O phosphotransferase
MDSGTILLLNGTSSAGKTSVAAAWQDISPDVYLYASIDGFLRMLVPGKYWHDGQEEPFFPKVFSGMHHCVAGLAMADCNIVVDSVFQNREWLMDALAVWANLRVFLVGVRCPLDELERRERARGDRNPGLAWYQFERVHALMQYDVEVDTSVLTPRECALRIQEPLQTTAPTAFAQVAAALKPE